MPGLGSDPVGDCLSSLALDAWWLATTSRWRTTPALHRSPTKPVLCSRFREHSEKSARIPSLTFSSALQGQEPCHVEVRPHSRAPHSRKNASARTDGPPEPQR